MEQQEPLKDAPAEEPGIPFCIDCKWIAPPKPNSIDLACAHKDNKQLDPVTGTMGTWTASWMRSPAAEHLCGPKGKWFEARATKQ
jgi:hypothetical protein